LLLQEDEEIWRLAKAKEGSRFPLLRDLFRQLRQGQPAPFSYLLSLERQRLAQRLLQQVVQTGRPRRRSRGGAWAETLSRLTMRPLTGIPILLLVLYFGLYQFVGVFGAGTAVDFLEEVVFGRYLLPPVTRLVQVLLPWPIWQQLFIGEYGIITLGVRYALAIILPIVGTFFLFFSLLEDSGYFPRLAMLVDGLFKKIGLNGRAVIPLVLGFGCDTMATITTRILETRRERVIATLLLALAIPCSAQLGVILALLSAHPAALAVWASVVAFVFLLVGYLSAQVLPGERPSFYMEIPPLRVPALENVLTKTAARMQWYFLEVFPIFILASVLIWLGQLTGLFPLLIRLVEPVMRLLGLPPQAAVAFLFGFFRRDYGAAGLFDLHKAGALTPAQLLVASVTLTLFVPCIAQFSVMVRERGAKTALAIFLFVLLLAVGTGYAVHLLLEYSGVSL
ncbi:MAG: ferrous iron transporter B, partial [Bacillota bacterium]|nr:ferrous iron transporter B [Bacillota bacterium]